VRDVAIGRRKGGGDQLAAVIDLCSRAAQLARPGITDSLSPVCDHITQQDTAE
jgi:hypothetical protein